MRILQIINDYAGSKVHSLLTKQLDILGIQQTVYCPLRDKSLVGKNQHEGQYIDFKYSLCIRPWHKYLYHLKVHQLCKDLKKNVNLQEYDMIHASTAFSDGALAYYAYKKYGIPYVVAIRNTDYSVFVKKMLYHTWPLCREILQHAKKIYFISASLQHKFIRSVFIKPILDQTQEKMEVRPNGIDKCWIDNHTRTTRNGRKLCFVGTFLKRKNLVRVIEAIAELRKETTYKDVTLRVIGGGGDIDGSSQAAIDSHLDFVEAIGIIKDKNKLISNMRECSLFIMPSFHETFGLVYIEALSQNLPVVYTKNDGIDGLFDSSIGVAVNPLSVPDIKDAIKSILDNPSRYGNSSIDFLDFSWANIAQKYLADYINILK